MTAPYWSDGAATIWHANARALPLPDGSVDLVVTSPPYFGLRDYRDNDASLAGQLGSEPTPVEFVDALIAATREMVRVLKPSGSLWINLGDRYAGGGGQWDKDERSDPQKRRAASGSIGTGGNTYGLRPKSLIGIPWRYALRCIDDLGLILRAEVIWSKPNGLPESVQDRVRRSHEQWFHLTREPRYYSAVDEVREAHLDTSDHAANRRARMDSRLSAAEAGMTSVANPLGKLPGSVWTIPTQPLRVPAHLGIDHFAAFPMEWPRRIITGWSPRDVCGACGEGRRPVSHNDPLPHQAVYNGGRESAQGRTRGGMHSGVPSLPRVTITGYACACPDTTAPTTPGVILDPFMGTGTTMLVASALGRTSHGVDLSADYCRLAQWRIADPGERARALEVEKPAVEIDGQEDLLTLIEGAP